MRFWGAAQALGGLLAVVAVAAVAGAALGAGPLAGPLPADRVTDPREMLARSLQSVLDARTVHLEASLEGTVPGALLGRGDAQVDLRGTAASADISPKDVRTRIHLDSTALGVTLDTVSSWDDLWFRTASDQPWTRASVGGATAEAGVNPNPLTLVDRLRSWLARPDLAPTVTDVPCAATSGRCHRVVLEAGKDPAELLKGLLPLDRREVLPPLAATLVLDTDASTLRPARLEVLVRSDDGTVDLRLVVDASDWDRDVTIEVPSVVPSLVPSPSPSPAP
jgi:hypothetical protein